MAQIVYDPTVHAAFQSRDYKGRVEAIHTVASIVSVIDTGKAVKDTQGKDVASVMLRMVATLYPDRESFIEARKVQRESKAKGTGLKEELPRFLGVQFDAMDEACKAFTKSRTAQAQFSQAKAAYAGEERKGPNPKATILALLGKMDAATLGDALAAVARAYPEHLIVKVNEPELEHV